MIQMYEIFDFFDHKRIAFVITKVLSNGKDRDHHDRYLREKLKLVLIKVPHIIGAYFALL
jgi:hypothetical protein